MALRELTVENLAVVESVRLSLAPGFTVLTGETGAGKSLVVDAVALALGARASSDQVRAGPMAPASRRSSTPRQRRTTTRWPTRWRRARDR